MGELHPKPKFSIFCTYLNIINIFFLKNNISILKKIVWKSQK